MISVYFKVLNIQLCNGICVFKKITIFMTLESEDYHYLLLVSVASRLPLIQTCSLAWSDVVPLNKIIFSETPAQ